MATFDENRRAVGMLNPMRNKNEGTYRGGEGTTPVITACPEDRQRTNDIRCTYRVPDMEFDKSSHLRVSYVWSTSSVDLLEKLGRPRVIV